MLRPLAIVSALALVLAGCLGSGTDSLEPTAAAPAPPPAPTSVLAGAVEPTGLDAPTFALIGALSKGGPAYGAGEPSIWAHLDGTVYISFPGCDNGLSIVGLFMAVPGVPECQHGLVFKSTDSGTTWERLNDEMTGRLAEDGPPANGDADIAVDAAGNVYASDLGGGIQVFSSADGGATWGHAGNVVPEDHWADRQWMAAAHPGHLIMTWMGGKDEQRAVAINTTWDGGKTWSGTQYVGEDIGWIGTVQFDPAGTGAFVPFTQPKGAASVDPFGFVGGDEFQLLVARTLDGGHTWDVVDTGATVVTSSTGMHWSGVLMAPALDVTGDGHVVYAWAEDVLDGSGHSSTGAVVKFVASGDWGTTWSAPVTVSERVSSIMPWVTAGAGDRVAITYYASDVPADSDYAGSWDVMVAVVDGVGSDAPEIVNTLIEEGVHQGGLCSRGGGCLFTGSDRALLDFFEADLLPDGNLIVVYPADPLTGGKYIDIRVAVQAGGTPLLVPAGGAPTTAGNAP